MRLAKAQPYECYEEMEFDIPVGKNGDTYDRQVIRMEEMRESVKIMRQCVAKLREPAGQGPIASTDGKFAPALAGVSAEHVYEAMITGPQNMPVFNDANLTPEQKADIITYLKYLDQNPSPGGFDLGSLGPVSEGLFIWIFGLGAVVGVTIWIAAKAN